MLLFREQFIRESDCRKLIARKSSIKACRLLYLSTCISNCVSINIYKMIFLQYHFEKIQTKYIAESLMTLNRNNCKCYW